MPRVLKSSTFWVGVVTGAIIGPWALSKFAPAMKAKLPAQQ